MQRPVAGTYLNLSLGSWWYLSIPRKNSCVRHYSDIARSIPLQRISKSYIKELHWYESPPKWMAKLYKPKWGDDPAAEGWGLWPKVILTANWRDAPCLLKLPPPGFGVWHDINVQPDLPREQEDRQGRPLFPSERPGHARILFPKEPREALPCGGAV